MRQCQDNKTLRRDGACGARPILTFLYIDVTCTLDCWPPEDAEEFPENFQPFSQIENAQEKARLRWKMQIVPVAFQFFGMIFALMTFQHATQAAFSFI